MERSKGTILLAEMIGTFVLVLGGCGTAVLAGKVVGGTLGRGDGLRPHAAVHGLRHRRHLGLPHQPGGDRRAAGQRAQCAPTTPLYYFVGQVIGGIIAGGVLYAIALSQAGATRATIVAGGFASNGYGTHSPAATSSIGAIIVEIVLTGVFVFVVGSTFHRSFPGGFGGDRRSAWC